jgi:LytS/YehU family sensor histidine kinase
MFYSFSVIIIAIAYRSVIAWQLQEKKRRDLENQKLKAELAFLESQVNPHFLFNALNNIYSLSVLENSKLTGQSLLKLSDLLRYMLYEKEEAGDLVPLDKEVQHINNYIDLEKIRHRGPIYIDFSIEGDIQGKMVVPLLIFPLIENACKHGILTDAKNPVTILLKVTGERLQFTLANYCNNYQKDKASGIGIRNVKKRLELIYGTKHTFEETKTDNRYTVNLNLPLS